MNILTQLGMRIRYLRKQKGMSQLDLSLEADINKNYIFQFLNINTIIINYLYIYL